MERTTIILLAGGSSSRMQGRDKLMEDISGTPLIANRAQMCSAAKAGPVLVVLPPDRPMRDAAIKGHDVRRIHTSGTIYGMSHSLKLALQAVETSSAMIILADMPDITTADIHAILSEAALTSASVIRGAKNDIPGHPVLIKQALFGEIETLTGDEGAQKILARYRDQTRLVALPDDHATCDLDTPEAWETWRALTQTTPA